MAQSNTILTAHVVVEFAGGDSNLQVIAEVDDREDGYNAGQTTFYPGDTPHLLLFVPTGYVVDTVLVSAGNIAQVAVNSVKHVEDYAVFANEDSTSLRYPFSDNFTYRWLGSDLGALTLSGQFAAKLPARAIVGGEPVPKYRIGIAKVTYDSYAYVYKIYGVPVSVEQVIAFFVVRKA